MSKTPSMFHAVYLGLVPVEHKSEGLNVLFCDTIRPLVDDGVQVVIHTTKRHRIAIEKALSGNGIELNKIDIVAYPVGSFGLSVLGFLLNRKRPEGARPRLPKLVTVLQVRARSLAQRAILWFMDTTVQNFPVRLMVFPLLSLAAAVAGLLSGLFILILLVLFGLLRILRNAGVRIVFALRGRQRVWQVIKKVVRSFMTWVWGDLLYTLYDREQVRFANAVGRKSAVDRLFFFTAFEGAAVENFRGKKLVVFPDAVACLFPIRFQDFHNKHILESIRRSVAHADALVCYSEFVRDRQLQRLFGKQVEGKRVEVIPQGYFQIQKNIDVAATIKLRLNSNRNLLKNLFPGILADPPSVDFNDFDFIIYPTIDRPHKNFLILLRAFEILLRRRHRNIKLVLTTPSLTEDAYRFVSERRLQYDLLMLPSVPKVVLDDLFRGASLMVHSSLAEGGDIFNFSRAVSAGCPALMADIPVVREMFERDGVPVDVFSDWLFDPFEAIQLADKMDVVLGNPLRWLEPQTKVLHGLSRHGFEEMAMRYVNLYGGL